MSAWAGSTTAARRVAGLAVAALAAGAASLSVGPMAAGATGTEGGVRGDVRVSPDDRPGAYRRLDGSRDAVHDACALRRRQQVEPAVAVNPRDPRVIAAGAMDACIAVRNPVPVAQPQHALAYYRSADGGRSWQASLFPGWTGDPSPSGPAADLGCAMQGDPTMAFDREGRLFYAALCPVFVGDFPVDFQIAVATFDEDGARFVRAVRVDPTPPPEQEAARATDRPNVVVDLTEGPHAGTVYVAYTECPGPGTPCARLTDSVVHVVRSTDHGETFSEPVTVPPPDGRFPSAADLAVAPDGSVYLTFRTSPTDGQRPVWLARSTDGGRTFSQPQLVARFPTFDSGQFSGGGGDAFGNCGDGTFACASGFTFPVFASFSQVTADEAGVHVAWNAELPSGQAKVFVRSSPDGIEWPSPPVQVDQVGRGHQWFPDIASADGVITVVFLDSRRDRAYSPDRPPGTTAQGTSSGPAVDTFAATSRDGGRTWRERRLNRRPSQPNHETYHEARVPWRGDYIYVSAVHGAGTFAAWVDSRDVVTGDDTRPDSAENGFDVFVPCGWVPDTVNGPPIGYPSPPLSHPCFDQGGLDVNIYGAWVSRRGPRGARLARPAPGA